MSIRLLVVDESDTGRRNLVNAVVGLGWHVCGEASDSLEALDRYAELRPDFVLIDPIMSSVDTRKAISRFFEKDPDARIIVCSLLTPGETQAAFEAGAKDSLPKPINREKLSEVVNKLLKGDPTAITDTFAEDEVTAIVSKYARNNIALDAKSIETHLEPSGTWIVGFISRSTGSFKLLAWYSRGEWVIRRYRGK